MVTMRVNVKADGPVFRRGVPERLLAKHVNATIQELVEQGEQHLDQLLKPRPSGVYLSVSQARQGQASTGHYRRSVHGRVTNNGGLIDDSGVVYGPWLEGVSPRNMTTRFKGYNSFRRTTQWLDRQAPRILRGHVVNLARELNG